MGGFQTEQRGCLIGMKRRESHASAFRNSPDPNPSSNTCASFIRHERTNWGNVFGRTSSSTEPETCGNSCQENVEAALVARGVSFFLSFSFFIWHGSSFAVRSHIWFLHRSRPPILSTVVSESQVTFDCNIFILVSNAPLQFKVFFFCFFFKKALQANECACC